MEQETRYQRVAREQQERQAARTARLAAETKQKRPCRRAARKPAVQQEAEDQTPFGQGDNLGESPDY